MRTLVVEDNFINRQLMMKMLSPLGQSDVAMNGKEAVIAFQKSLEEGPRYDLICLDIMMPEMDGHEALVEIRRLEQEHGISHADRTKILMTTAVDACRSKKEAEASGSDGYLTKPIMKVRLYEELEIIELIAEEELSTLLAKQTARQD